VDKLHTERVFDISSWSADPGLVVGTLTISEIDETNKTISGTFSSKILHGDLVSEVTSGEFNKVPYEIIPPNTMTVKIDGVDFTAPTVVASGGFSGINILGKTPSESQTIQIAFNSDIAVGTHPMGEFGDDIHAIYTVDNTSFVSSSGTLTITKHDTSAKSVEGTFSFVGESVAEDGTTHTLTAGTFFILYY
jgi:hypothetical protein